MNRQVECFWRDWIRQMLTEEGKKYSDVTFFIVDGSGRHEYNCHKLILAAKGGKFLSSVVYAKNAPKCFQIDDVSKCAFELALQTIYGTDTVYGNNVNINNENICQAWYCALRLELEDLKKKCIHYIAQLSDDEELFKIFLNLQENLAFELYKLLIENKCIVERLTMSFFNQKLIGKLDWRMLQLFFKSDYLRIAEESVWCICSDICKRANSNKSWQMLMKEFFVENIRFPVMSFDFLASEVRNTGVLSVVEILEIYDCKTLAKQTKFNQNKRK